MSTFAADVPRWRVGRAGAYAVVVGCVALFGTGLVAWASDPATQQAAVLWSLPDTWSVPALHRAIAGAGLPFPVVAAYFMLLDLLWALAGVTAALVVLRGARSWFRCYLGSVLAVWATTGSALVAVYDAGVTGPATLVVELLFGLGWCGAIALAYLFPDGRFVPAWTRWCVLALALYLPVLVVLESAGVADGTDDPGAVLPLLVIFATAAYAAVHRYRITASPGQRRQVRGVMAALVLWLGVVRSGCRWPGRWTYPPPRACWDRPGTCS